MSTARYFYKAAKASIVHCGDVSTLTIISVPSVKRGSGIGSELMKRVIQGEFKRSRIIRLQCRPDDDVGFSVKAWYKRLGFKDTGEGTWMELKKP